MLNFVFYVYVTLALAFALLLDAYFRNFLHLHVSFFLLVLYYILIKFSYKSHFFLFFLSGLILDAFHGVPLGLHVTAIFLIVLLFFQFFPAIDRLDVLEDLFSLLFVFFVSLFVLWIRYLFFYDNFAPDVLLDTFWVLLYWPILKFLLNRFLSPFRGF